MAMNFRKTLLLLPLSWGALISGLVLAHPVGGGPVGGPPMGGGEVGRNPSYPSNVYPIVAPYAYPTNTPGAYDPINAPPVQGGSSVTNGNQTINANGTTCTVRPDGKKICN
jgi:hypothetical protein